MDAADTESLCASAADAPADAETHHAGGWMLVLDLGSLRRDRWLLTDGRRALPLTRAEHAAIACLFESPDLRATNDALTQAILGTWQFPGTGRRRTTVDLSVTIGRLRSRARRAGIRIVCVRESDSYRWVG